MGFTPATGSSWSPPTTPTPACGPATAAPSPASRDLPEPTIDVHWDNGSTLSILPDAGDRIRKLPGDHTRTHPDPASPPPTPPTHPPGSPAAQLTRPANRPPSGPRPTPQPPGRTPIRSARNPPRQPVHAGDGEPQTTPGGVNGEYPIGHRPPHP